DNIQLVECLKRKPFEDLLDLDSIKSPRFLSPFGPIIDGIVVIEDPRIMMESMAYQMTSSRSSSLNVYSSTNIYQKNSTQRYASLKNALWEQGPYFDGDIMFGVTQQLIPLNIFNGQEERFGISIEHRNRILRTLIRNLFDFHQQTIFWTLINEYTDWTRPYDHPINLLDSTVQILSDALVLSPLIETAELFFKSIISRKNFPQQKSHHYHQQQQQQRQQQSNNIDSRMYFYVFQNEPIQSYQSINPSTIMMMNHLISSGGDGGDGGSEIISTTTNNPASSLSSSSSSSSSSPSASSLSLISLQQRLGSMLNDELEYLFGAPIAQHVTGHSIGHLQIDSFENQIDSNIHLSKMMILYFSNFARFGYEIFH
ncbi:Neuroligin-like protein, partial [Sarcoptes scabiei]